MADPALSVTRRIATSFGAQLAVHVAGLLAILLGTRLLTGLVEPAVFGSYSLCLLGMQLAGNALGQATIQHALMRSSAGWAASIPNRFVLGGLAVMGLLCAFPLVILQAAPRIWAICFLCLLWTFVDFRLRASIALLNATGRQGLYACWTALLGPLSIWSAYVASWVCGPELAWMVGAGCASSTLALSVLHASTSTSSTSNPDAGPGIATLMTMLPVAGLIWALTAGERYLIAWLGDLEMVGIYAAGYALATRPILIFCNNVALPRVRPEYYRLFTSDRTAADRLLRRGIIATLAAVLAGVSVLTVILPWILDLVLAPEYHSCRQLVPWIGLAYAIWTVVLFAELPIIAQNRMPRLLPVYACGGLVQAVAVGCGVAHWREFGAAMGVVLGMLSTLAFISFAGRRQ
jgi:O-antigen/teichoic acid export membrane protein